MTVLCPAVFKYSLLEHTGDFHGITADGLRDSMDHSAYSSDDIAASLIKHMARRRLYSVPMHDAPITRCIKGWLPESFRRILLYLYRHKLWIFKPAD